MVKRQTRKRGGGYGVSERYFGVHTSLGSSEVPSSISTASYIRPPLVMQGGRRQTCRLCSSRRKKQYGGGDYGYTGSSQYYGIQPTYHSGPPAPSSAATPEYIRPPLNQQGGFGATLMGPFANTAARVLPIAVAATAYKTYQSYKNSKKSKKAKKRSRR